MIYTSQFKNIAGENYEVHLHTNYLTQDNQITHHLAYMGSNPIVVKRESGKLYKPYKCSTATFQYYLENPYTMLQNLGHNNTFIKVLKVDGEDKTTIFQGYVTDQSFNQNFSYEADYFELEAQDALSVLKYKKYQRQGKTQDSIVSFETLILNMIGRLGVYRNLYITTALQAPSNDSKQLFSQLYVSEDNFFDEDGNSINELEVIEEICKYLSLSCIPHGDSVYFVNYEAIRAGYNEYYQYDFNLDNSHSIFKYPTSNVSYHNIGEVILSNQLNLNDLSLFVSDDTNISIENTYQKITLKSDLYPYEDIIPDLNDLDNYSILQTNDNLGKYGTMYSNGQKNTLEEIGDGRRYDLETKQILQDGNNENIRVFDIRNTPQPHKLFLRLLKWGEIEEVRDGLRPISLDSTSTKKFDITTYVYQKNTRTNNSINLVHLSDNKLNYKSLCDYVMCMPAQYALYDISENLPSHISFTGINWLFSLSEEVFNNNQTQPMLRINIKDVKMKANNYLVIDFNMQNFHNHDFLPHDLGGHKELLKADNAYWLVSIKVGNKYYSIQGNKYNDISTVTKLPLQIKPKETIEGRKIGVKSNINYRSKLGNSRGFAIPLTNSKHIDIQDIEIVFYRPHFMGVNGDNSTQLVVMSDLDIKIITQTNEKKYIPTKIEENLEHYNVIDSTSYEELNDIELKLSTNLNDGYNKSTIYRKEYDKLYNLEYLYNKANGELLLPEQHIINNSIKQYDTPTTTLNTTIFNTNIKPYTTARYHYFSNLFIVDEVTENIKENTTTLSLIEKK